MRSLLGVIVVCIALVCSFSFYGESNGYCVSVPDGEPTEDEQYFESSDCDEEDTCDEDSTCDEEEEEMIFHEELLNDIRFADYDDDDWLDNEYIQALRHYLDDIDVSKIKNERIKPYSKVIKGQFVIFRIEISCRSSRFGSFGSQHLHDLSLYRCCILEFINIDL